MMNIKDEVVATLLATEDKELRFKALEVFEEEIIKKFGDINKGLEILSKIEVAPTPPTPKKKKIGKSDREMIDTIELTGSGYLDSTSKNSIKGFLDEKSSRDISKDEDSMLFKAVIRVAVSNGSLASFDDTLERIKEVENMQDVEKLKLTRVDIATDIEMSLEDDYKVLRTFSELVRVATGGKRSSVTKIDTDKVGNIKISSNKERLAMTIYSNDDKINRLNGYRVEFRQSRLRNSNTEESLINVRKKWNEVLKEVVNDYDNLIKRVESKVINDLKKTYDKLLNGNEIKTFTDFVVHSNADILTEGILLELHRYSKLKGNGKTWKKKYTKTRTLDLIKKTEIKNLIKKLNK